MEGDAAQRYGYAPGGRSQELADTSMTDGAFFQIDTPPAGSNSEQQSRAFSMIDGGSELGSNRHQLLEEGGAMKPWPEIVLRWKRFGMALTASIVLVVGLTIWFWNGIKVKTLKEPVGNSSESEKLLRRYNTYSGVTMGIFEAFLGLGFAQFFPAFTVYVHNLKWWPGDDPSVKTSKVKKVLLLLFFPVVMIAVGNSFSALQAGTSTIGLEVFMNASSLGFNRTAANERLNLSSLWPELGDHQYTILKSAVQRKSVPFEFVQSRCRKEIESEGDEVFSGLKRMTDIDSTSAVFGFPLKEWSREVYPDQPGKISNQSLSLQTSFELLFQGQALLERAIGGLPTERCRYFAANQSETCRKRSKRTALDPLYGYLNGTKTQTEAALRKEIFAATQNAFFGDIDETVNLTMLTRTITISPQIEVQYMFYAVMLEKSFEFGIKGETEVSPKNCSGNTCQYRYFMYDQDTFCGEKSCVIPDWQADVIPRKQASMMQYKKNCKQNMAAFDSNLQAVVPGGCEDEENAVFFMGFGSRIYLDTLDMGTTSNGDKLPFALNPRRAMAITVGKLVWKYEDLTQSLKADCNVEGESTDACVGLKHKLQPSERFVVVGKQYVSHAIAGSDFRSPINLFQLMTPKILSPRATFAVAVPEYLDANSLRTSTGSIQVTVAANKCSPLADAFIRHTAQNRYFLYATSQPMYMSALLYIFQRASVTKIRNNADALSSRMQLVGDRAMKRIVIKNTDVGVYTVWIGCIILVILAFVTLMFPNERARLKPMMGKNARAERFVAVQTEEVYPNLVYMKRFRIGKTGEALKFSEFSVEAVTLHHKMEDDEQVHL